jgi:hypothetical protein
MTELSFDVSEFEILSDFLFCADAHFVIAGTRTAGLRRKLFFVTDGSIHHPQTLDRRRFRPIKSTAPEKGRSAFSPHTRPNVQEIGAVK